jgi:hypothetical protein
VRNATADLNDATIRSVIEPTEPTMAKGQRAGKETKKPSKAKLAAKALTPPSEIRPTIVTVVPERTKKKPA